MRLSATTAFLYTSSDAGIPSRQGRVEEHILYGRDIKHAMAKCPKNDARMAYVGLVCEHDFEDGDVLEHGG